MTMFLLVVALAAYIPARRATPSTHENSAEGIKLQVPRRLLGLQKRLAQLVSKAGVRYFHSFSMRSQKPKQAKATSITTIQASLFPSSRP